jgi:hypothetical protein
MEQQNKKRGRKSRENLITDLLIEPYFISLDESCFTVCKNEGVSYENIDFNNKKEVKILGYFSNMKGALKKIIEQKLNDKSYSSVKEYLNSQLSLTEKINKIINI